MAAQAAGDDRGSLLAVIGDEVVHDYILTLPFMLAPQLIR